MGFGHLRYSSEHRGELSRVIILFTSHLGFDHNNLSIDCLPRVLKTGSQLHRISSIPRGSGGHEVLSRPGSDDRLSSIESPRPRKRHPGRPLRPAAPELRILASVAPAVYPTNPANPAKRGPNSRSLGFGFLGLAGVTYILVVLGALVRANGAGLACPDWPLCFGELVPRFDMKIAFEWGHRALAGSVGLAFLALSGLTLRRRELRRPMWLALLVTALLLAVQIVLGGLTVLELLASWTVTSHLVTGNAFALALVLLARKLLDFDSTRPAGVAPATNTLRILATVAGGLLTTQIVLGGLVSSNYAGLVCPDWPTCMNGEYFPTWSGIQGLHLFHRSVGYACLIGIIAAAVGSRSHSPSRPWLMTAAVISLCQVAVGIANVLLRLPVEITGLHSALAAGLICTVGIGVREVWRTQSTQP
ncbi:MAG TPA: hypothetical protein EYG54_03305 [Myxococcales bacterium]|nr:hypothetical protein [Myxococcales bacterium]